MPRSWIWAVDGVKVRDIRETGLSDGCFWEVSGVKLRYICKNLVLRRVGGAASRVGIGRFARESSTQNQILRMYRTLTPDTSKNHPCPNQVFANVSHVGSTHPSMEVSGVILRYIRKNMGPNPKSAIHSQSNSSFQYAPQELLSSSTAFSRMVFGCLQGQSAIHSQKYDLGRVVHGGVRGYFAIHSQNLILGGCLVHLVGVGIGRFARDIRKK